MHNRKRILCITYALDLKESLLLAKNLNRFAFLAIITNFYVEIINRSLRVKEAEYLAIETSYLKPISFANTEIISIYLMR